MNRYTLNFLLGLSLAMSQACWAADTYNPTTNQLSIPNVDVSGTTYKDVVITVGGVIRIDGGTPSGSVDVYNPASNQLSIPSVNVNGQTYTNVVISVGQVVSVGAQSIAPIPLAKTSYENAKAIGVSQIKFPDGTGWLKWGDTTNAYGVADFFQRGKRDLFTTTLNYSTLDNYSEVVTNPKSYSDMEFWTSNNDGTYTKKLSFKGCLQPRKALIADFNNDGLPDVFVGCTGWDGPVPANVSDWAGEKSKLLLNDGKGGFAVRDIGTKNYIHGASAADLNGDGWIDMVVADVTHSWNGQTVYALINNKDGTFKEDLTRFPKTPINSQYVSVELIDVNGDGNYDAVIGSGAEQDGDPTQILYGDSSGNFGRNGNVVTVPPVKGRGVILDFTLVVDGSNRKQLLVGRTSDFSAPKYYFTNTVQKFDVQSKTSTLILDEDTIGYSWVAWWMPVNINGKKGVTPYTFMNKGVITNQFIPY